MRVRKKVRFQHAKGDIMEIERKYLVTIPPEDYRTWEAVHMEQAYLCTAPVVRIRKENDEYFLTYKSKGLLALRGIQSSSHQRRPMRICLRKRTALSSQKPATKSQ